MAPRVSMTGKMHGRAINELIKVLMSFFKLVQLVIEKMIESDKVKISMPYVQSQYRDKENIMIIIIIITMILDSIIINKKKILMQI